MHVVLYKNCAGGRVCPHNNLLSKRARFFIIDCFYMLFCNVFPRNPRDYLKALAHIILELLQQQKIYYPLEWCQFQSEFYLLKNLNCDFHGLVLQSLIFL